MILSDSALRARISSGDIGIQTESDYDVLSQIGPASIDFRLWHHFKVYKRSKIANIDPRDPTTLDGMTEFFEIPMDDYFMLHPGQFVLGVTMEKIRVPYDLVCRCEGRSSLGRLGIVIHSTAGFIDPGFEGTITLEITNINEVPIKLYPGMRFGQLAFQTIEGVVQVPYDKRQWSKYMHQDKPQESKIMEDIH